MRLRKSVFSTAYPNTYPNLWDIAALAVVLATIVVLAITAKQMNSPFDLGEPMTIHLSAGYLPDYALRTVMRMFIAMGISLLITFIFGTWAAKSRHAERIIIPMVDILQSVPILGFLSISVPTFIGLFPQSMLGPECAAIFAIMTSQVWNMLLGFYQSLKTVPTALLDAARLFHLNAWQRFWRVEVPITIPSLLWNMMLSMSAGWFFVVASEAISVANQSIMLPGVGSYIAVAIAQSDKTAIVYAIMTMLGVIILYDQLLFRPLMSWSDKFRPDLESSDHMSESWVVDLFLRSLWFKRLGYFLAWLRDSVINIRLFHYREKSIATTSDRKHGILWLFTWGAHIAIYIAIFVALFMLLQFIAQQATWRDVVLVFGLGFATAIKIFILIIISSMIWIPVGVWVGLRPKAAAMIQPIAQFCAAFPANLLYPIIVIGIIHYHANITIWTAPLIILGTQWYILFNVIAGTTTLPKELLMATKLFGVKGWLKWKKVILPAIFPYYITGAITAAGGAWNATIVAEVFNWGEHTFQAIGLGAYISAMTRAGKPEQEALGIVVMCLFVVMINRLIWKPLYALAEERFHVE
jgi:NitT/TauT family transport system permease protein